MINQSNSNGSDWFLLKSFIKFVYFAVKEI